jgi:hypothetical protein
MLRFFNPFSLLTPHYARLVMAAKYMQAVGQVMDAAGYAIGVPIMNPLTDFGIAEAAGLKAERREK